jgi:hypothetical protein
MSWKERMGFTTPPLPPPPPPLTAEDRQRILALIASKCTDEEFRILEKLMNNNPVRTSAMKEAAKYLT